MRSPQLAVPGAHGIADARYTHGVAETHRAAPAAVVWDRGRGMHAHSLARAAHLAWLRGRRGDLAHPVGPALRGSCSTSPALRTPRTAPPLQGAMGASPGAGAEAPCARS